MLLVTEITNTTKVKYYPIPIIPLIKDGLKENSTSSCAQQILEWDYFCQKRIIQIRNLRGKYAYVRTSSEDFALRKQKDLELEG